MTSPLQDHKQRTFPLDDFNLPLEYDPQWSKTITINKSADLKNLSTTRVFDFGQYPTDGGRCDEACFWVAHAFKQWSTGMTISTVHDRFHALKHFFEFLATEQKQVSSLLEVNQYTLDLYIAWIRSHESWGSVLQRRAWTLTGQMFRILNSAKPPIVRTDLRFYRFGASADMAHPNVRPTKHILSRSEVGRILRACKQDIDSYRSVRSIAAEAMRAADGYDGRVDPSFDNLGQILIWLKRRYDEAPTNRETFDLVYRHVIRKRSLGVTCMDDLYRQFLIGARELTPYVILLAAYSGMNPESVLKLPTSCLDRPPGATGDNQLVAEIQQAFSGERETVYWSKGRANQVQHRSFRSERPYHPPALIREVIKLTSELRPRAPQNFRHNLFICDAMRRAVVWLRNDNMKWSLDEFRKKHSLPYFTLRALRPALLLNGYKVAKGNVASVRALANHRSSQTTHQSYLVGPAKVLNAEIIAKLQRQMAAWIIDGQTPSAADLQPAAMTTAAAHMAAAWLAAFSDPQLIVSTDEERTARLLQMRSHLVNARRSVHPARWARTYSPLFELIETKILPQIDEQTVSRAATLIHIMPDLPPIE